MKPRTSFLPSISIIILLLCNNNLKAENISVLEYGDTTCCAPYSLKIISTNYPDFCVSWHIPNDSVCKKVKEFVIQWRVLLSNNWETQIVTYTSGSHINFCDTVEQYAVYQWRVKTKCSDSTYSDWVWGNKFGFTCDSVKRSTATAISISPNPASQNITISMSDLKPGKLKLSVINMNGRNVYDKVVYSQQGQFTERISISAWQRGIYFVSIFENGVLINRKSFVKE